MGTGRETENEREGEREKGWQRKRCQMFLEKTVLPTSSVKELIVRAVDGFLRDVLHPPVGGAVLAQGSYRTAGEEKRLHFKAE